MKIAIQSMENLRIQEKTKKDVEVSENIEDELTMLQNAILEAERQMKLFREENSLLRQNETISEKLSEKLELENQSLLTRLKISEEGFFFLKNRLDSIQNEVSLSTFHEKDLKGKNVEKSDTQSQCSIREQEVIKSLVEDNNKFVIRIQEKDKTIQRLKENLDILSAEVERQIANESMKANMNAQEKEKHHHQFSEELTSIKETLDISHRDLTHKIVDLHEQLAKLNEENRTLRDGILKNESDVYDIELTRENETLKNENSLLSKEINDLKDILNKHYQGMDISVFAKEFDELREENKFLRFSINSERLELVDSNLRKKKRIKDMHKEIEELRSQLSSNSLQVAAPPSFTVSSPTLLNGETEGTLNSSRDNSKKQTTSKSSSSVEELELEISVRDGIISRLKEENENLQSKTNSYKVQLDKKNVEHELRKQNIEANSVLEGELRALRNMVKELGTQQGILGNKFQQEENNFDVDEGISDAKKVSNYANASTGNDCFSTLDTLDSINTQENANDINQENLQQILDAAYEELNRFKTQETINADNFNVNKEKIRILKEKNIQLNQDNLDLTNKLDSVKCEISDLNLTSDNSEEKPYGSNKDFKLKERKIKIRALNEENINLIQKLDAAKIETALYKKQISELNTDLDAANGRIVVIKNSSSEYGGRLYNIKMNDDQKNEIEVLEQSTETDEIEIANHSCYNQKETKIKHEDKRVVMEFENRLSDLKIKLSEENERLHQTKKENEELNDQNRILKENIEIINNDINEKNFKDCLEKDLDRRLAFLSPELRVTDVEETELKEKQTKRDHARIIRKLQVENQTLRTQMLNLEDEAVETTKIIADMERGHGHLTGTLRVHLILQKAISEKVLESSLQQYSTDYEILENKFKMMEKKYDQEKKYSKRRDAAWELFTNASGTIGNIQTILTDGLARVENDLDDSLSPEEFDNKDYRSRLWILKRQLSDVENRHRELQLKAEELNLRLNAKTTEFEVTQDELEDTTRDLESRESSIERLTKEMSRLLMENKKLNEILQNLKQNQDLSVGVALMENESLHKALADLSEEQDEIMKNAESDFNKVLAKLEEKDGALQQIKRMKDDSEKEIDALKRRINFLDKKLTQVGNERDKLKKEAEVRGRCTITQIDDHGTIHMLRNNLKALAKENSELKESVLSKQKVMYDMSKDLHQLRMETANNGCKNDKKGAGKDDVERKMIQDIADLKSQNFLLETKLKEADRRSARSPEKDEFAIQDIFYKKLKDKETEVETLKKEISGMKKQKPFTTKTKFGSDGNTTINPNDDSNLILESEVKYLTEQIEMLQNLVKQNNLDDEYDLLTSLKEDYEVIVDQQKSELESLNFDIDKKRKRIKELIKFIEEGKNEKDENVLIRKSIRLVDTAKDEEIESLTTSLEQRSSELDVWRTKAEHYKIELQRMRFNALHTATSGDFEQKNNGEHGTETFLKLPEFDANLDICTSPKGKNAIKESNASYTLNQPNVQNLNKKSRIPIRPSIKKKDPNEQVSAPNSVRIFTPSIQEPYIPEDSNERSIDNDQVKKFKILIKKLYDELNIYRTNLGIKGTNDLETIGQVQFNNLINYQIDKRHLHETEKLHAEIKQLLIEHMRLKEELNAIKSFEFRSDSDSSSDEFGSLIKESDIFAMTERCYLKIDENKTLKELLETQTQNVKSQSCVIQTLKNDIAEGHQKLNEDFRHICFTLKRKKRELRSLHKRLKDSNTKSNEEQKRTKKEIIRLKEKLSNEIRKRKHLAKEKENVTKKLAKTVEFISSKVNKEDKNFEEIPFFLKDIDPSSTTESLSLNTNNDCNEALKEAEEALHVAKEKMVASNKEISGLKREIQIINKQHEESILIFEKTKNEMRQAIEDKNAMLSSVQSEYLEQKESATKEIKKLQYQIIETEKECRDKINAALMSSISELESKRYEDSTREKRLSSKVLIDENRTDIEDEIHQSYLISAHDDPTTTSMHELSNERLKTDSSFQTDPIGENDDIQRKYELEVEIEILHGCNEELESEINSLKLVVNDLETQLEEKTDNLKQTTDDLENSLLFIEEQDKNIESLIAEKKSLVVNLKTETEKIKALKKEDVKLKKNGVNVNEITNSTEIMSEIDSLQNENKYLKEKNKSFEKEMNLLATKLKCYEDEIKEKSNDLDQTTGDLEKALIYIQERELEFGNLLSDKGSSCSDNEKLIDGNHESPKTVNSSVNFSSDIAQLKYDLESKSLVIQTLKNELTDKIDQYDKAMSLLNIRRDESRNLILQQEKIERELEKKNYLIFQMKSKLDIQDLDFPDIYINESLEDGSQDFVLLQLDDIELWTEAEKEKLINDQRQSIFNIATILSSTRERNRGLEEQLEELRMNYQRIKREKKVTEEDVSSLSQELCDQKEKLQELRMLMHVSPDVGISNESKAIAFRTKLYCAYKELREKSIEIGTLQMCVNIKDAKIVQQEAEMNCIASSRYSLLDVQEENEKDKCHISSQIDIVESSPAEKLSALASEERLRKKQGNIPRKCDCYQNELVHVIDSLKELERNIMLKDEALKECYVINADRLEGPDLSVSEETFSTYLLETSVNKKKNGLDTMTSCTLSSFQVNKDTQTDMYQCDTDEFNYKIEDLKLRQTVDDIVHERDKLKDTLEQQKLALQLKEDTIKDLELQIEQELKKRNDGR